MLRCGVKDRTLRVERAADGGDDGGEAGWMWVDRSSV